MTDNYLERFPADQRDAADRAYQDGFTDGAAGAATHRIRRCKGNTNAWCLVALRDDGSEIDTHGSYVTALTIDALLRFAGGLLPGHGDLVEILYYPAD